MATSRLIRKGFVDSDRVNRLDWFSECLYHRLLLVADDYGLFDARIPYLKTQLFGMKPNPVRDADLQRALASVESAGLVRTYAVDGKPYVQILDYGQKVRSKPKCPPPPDCGQCADNCGQCADNCGGLRQNVSLDVDVDVDVYGDGDGDVKEHCNQSREPNAEAARGCAVPAQAPAEGGGNEAPGRRLRPADAGEVDAHLSGIAVLKLTPAERQKAALLFYNEMESVGWIDPKGRPIRDWKTSACNFAIRYGENAHTPFRAGRQEGGYSRNDKNANGKGVNNYDIR